MTSSTSSSLFDLTGRTAVVVGGTTGIGRAIALGLADAGADVVVTGRRQSVVEEVAALIEQKGRRTLRQPADIVVAAAGVTKRVSTLDMSEADWNRILDTNVTGMMRTYQAFARPMIARGSG